MTEAANLVGELSPVAPEDKEGVGFADGWVGRPTAYLVNDPEYRLGYRRGTVARYASGGNGGFDYLWKQVNGPMVRQRGSSLTDKRSYMLRADRLDHIEELAEQSRRIAAGLFPNDMATNINTALDFVGYAIDEAREEVKKSAASNVRQLPKPTKPKKKGKKGKG